MVSTRDSIEQSGFEPWPGTLCCVLGHFATHLILSASLHPDVQIDTSEFNAGGNSAIDWHPIVGVEEIFLVASCYKNWDKHQPDVPLGSYADFETSQ